MLDYQSVNSRANNNYNAYTYVNTKWKPHFHKNFELMVTLEGNVRVSAGESTELLSKGDCALILSNQVHSFETLPDSAVWIAVFSEDFVPEFASFIKDKQGSRIAFRCDGEVMSMLEKYLILSESSNLMKAACFYAVCDRYLRTMPTEPRKRKNDDMICRLLDYIAEHYTEEISLRTVADHFGYEYHYLSRLLNSRYQIDFRKFVNDYRVGCAVRNLKNGDMTLRQVALKSGFRSVRCFNDVFRATVGMSPTEYISSEIVKKM